MATTNMHARERKLESRTSLALMSRNVIKEEGRAKRTEWTEKSSKSKSKTKGQITLQAE